MPEMKSKEELAIDLLNIVIKHSSERAREDVFNLYVRCRSAVGAGPTAEEWLEAIPEDVRSDDDAEPADNLGQHP